MSWIYVSRSLVPNLTFYRKLFAKLYRPYRDHSLCIFSILILGVFGIKHGIPLLKDILMHSSSVVL